MFLLYSDVSLLTSAVFTTEHVLVLKNFPDKVVPLQ